MDVEGAAHTDALRHQIGMAQREIHGMIAAEAAAGDRELGHGLRERTNGQSRESE